MKWLAILPIIAGEADVRTADIFTAVHRAADLRPGLTPMSIDEFYTVDGADVAVRASRCGSDVGCIAGSVRGIRVESSTASLALLVVLNLEVTPAILGVNLISLEESTVLSEHFATIPDRKSVASAIEAGTTDVLAKAGFRRGGRISVKTDPPEAIVSIDGAPVPLGSGVFLPGAHRVVASVPGRTDVSREVIVDEGQRSEVMLVLEEGDSIAASPWLWIGLGIGAAVIGGAVTAGVLLGRDRCECVSTGGDCSGGCP